MTRFIALILLVWSVMASVSVADPGVTQPVRSIGSNRVLFLDHTYVETSQNTRLKLHPPRKTGERLIESDRVWESATLNWFSVLRDGEKYRMWYECYDIDGWPTADDTSFCYAESEDGVHWVKPSLGLFAYQGNADNNIIFREIGTDQHRSRVHGSCVFLDPHAAPDARYKCVSQGRFQGIGSNPYYVAGMTSPDGLHWTRLPEPICGDFADSQYSGFWDEAQQQFALFGRAGGRGGRAIGHSISSRFEAFPRLTESVVLQVDEDEAEGCDLYNPACQQYPGMPEWYLMFPSRFCHSEDTLDIRLAVSRDGVTWTWPDRETPFISLGADGDFDSGSLYMANGACVPTAEGFSFYFSASPLKHEQVDLPNLEDPKNQRVITRAVAPRDRLVSVTAGASGGTVQTPLVQFAGNRLTVNVSVATGGRIRIALLDAQGMSLPGRSIEQCQTITGDDTASTVCWADGCDVELWSGQPVRLRIELHDANLFGFQFIDAAN